MIFIDTVVRKVPYLGIDTWIAYVIACAILAAIPGPSVLLITGMALANGRRAAFSCIAGGLLGGTCLILLTLLGIGALMAASTTLFFVVKWVGVAYLAYLGFRQIIDANRNREKLHDDVDQSRSSRRHFRSGLLTELLNPKSIAFHMAFLAQFIDPTANLPFQYLTLVVTNAAVGCAVLVGYALVASRARQALRSDRAQRRIKYMSGSFYIGGSALMATTR